jgi:hypothetical protein
VKCACPILSSVAWPDLPHFSTFSRKKIRFSKKIIDHKMCVLFPLQLLSKPFLILGITERDMITMYRSAGKSLARPGKKQATATEDIDVHISYL